MKVMKFALMTAGIIVILTMAGIFIFLKTFNANVYLPRITEQVSRAIGREVKVDSAVLGLSWTHGLSVQARGITLAEDHRAAQKISVSVPRVSGSVNIPALLWRRDIRINDIRLTDASVRYVDEAAVPQLDLTIDRIDVMISSFSLEAPFDLTMKAAVFSAGQNVSMNARVSLDMTRQAVRITDLRLDLDLAKIDPARLEGQLPVVKPAVLKKLGGTFNLAVSDAQADTQGLSVLKATAAMTRVIVVSGLIDLPVQDIEALADIDLTQIDVRSITAVLADGQIKGNALVMNYLTVPVVGVTFNIDRMDMKKALLAMKLPVGASGMLTAGANVRFSGRTPQEMMVSLGGDFKGGINDGVMNADLLSLGLGKIPMLPGLLDSIKADLPPATREQMDRGITRFETCMARGRLTAGVFQFEAVDIVTPDLAVNARGPVALAGDMDVHADIRIAGDLSGVLALRVKDLGALRDEQGRIHVPMAVTGSLARPRVMPDIGYLAQKFLAARGGEELGRIMGAPEAAQAVSSIIDLFRKK